MGPDSSSDLPYINNIQYIFSILTEDRNLIQLGKVFCNALLKRVNYFSHLENPIQLFGYKVISMYGNHTIWTLCMKLDGI